MVLIGKKLVKHMNGIINNNHMKVYGVNMNGGKEKEFIITNLR